MQDGNKVLVKKSSKILLLETKQTKQQENLNKANEAVLKGYVTCKGCQFETNMDNQSNMSATANLMQAQGIEATQWLSKDNIPIELTLNDFLNIGGLILNYKTNLQTNVYAGFEAQIEAAQTIEDVENIVINYNVFSAWGMLSSLREAIQPRRILLYAGGRLRRPPATPLSILN